MPIEHDKLNKAKEIFFNSIKPLNLEENIANALFFFVIYPDGFEKNEGIASIGELLDDIDYKEAAKIFVSLLGDGLIIKQEKNNGDERYLENKEKTKITDSIRQEIINLLDQEKTYIDEGEPHSEGSLNGLDMFFKSSEKPIYLACEWAPPDKFRKLTWRAEKRFKTVFLMPHKRHVPEAHLKTYENNLRNWKILLKENPTLRKYTRIQITSSSLPELHTSGYRSDLARFRVRFLKNVISRRGNMLEVKKETSLYNLIEKEYLRAIRSSYPLLSIWPVSSVFVRMKINFLPISLLATGCLFSLLARYLEKSVNSYFITLMMTAATVAIGLFVRMIGDKIPK